MEYDPDDDATPVGEALSSLEFIKAELAELRSTVGQLIPFVREIQLSEKRLEVLLGVVMVELLAVIVILLTR